jgi:hypothetical protein
MMESKDIWPGKFAAKEKTNPAKITPAVTFVPIDCWGASVIYALGFRIGIEVK